MTWPKFHIRKNKTQKNIICGRLIAKSIHGITSFVIGSMSWITYLMFFSPQFFLTKLRNMLSTFRWCHVVDGKTKILHFAKVHDYRRVPNTTNVLNRLISYSYLVVDHISDFLFCLFVCSFFSFFPPVFSFVILPSRKCYPLIIGAT